MKLREKALCMGSSEIQLSRLTVNLHKFPSATVSVLCKSQIPKMSPSVRYMLISPLINFTFNYNYCSCLPCGCFLAEFFFFFFFNRQHKTEFA